MRNRQTKMQYNLLLKTHTQRLFGGGGLGTFYWFIGGGPG
jgi:hypothetical protein